MSLNKTDIKYDQNQNQKQSNEMKNEFRLNKKHRSYEELLSASNNRNMLKNRFQRKTPKPSSTKSSQPPLTQSSFSDMLFSAPSKLWNSITK